MIQPPFGDFDHDSIQYHAFCGNFVCAARIFSTRSLVHTSAWVYDGNSVRTVFGSTQTPVQSSAGHCDVEADGIFMRADDRTAAIRLSPENSADAIDLHFDVRSEVTWNDTISTVIHQPDMECQVVFGGATHTGKGYAKRYTWTPCPHNWGYRFIQGYAGDINLWTAEATFGEDKYDYFKMIAPDGTVSEAERPNSCHRMNAAFATVGGDQIAVEIEEIGRWQVDLRSAAMDSLLRQRMCHLQVTRNGEVHTGYAINETCYGTLG